jgi:hypothetical protein
MHHIRPGRAYAGSFFYVVAAFSSLCGGGGVLSVFAPSFFCAFFGAGVPLLFCPAWWRSWVAFYALLDQPPGFLAHPDDTLGTVRVATGFEM